MKLLFIFTFIFAFSNPAFSRFGDGGGAGGGGLSMSFDRDMFLNNISSGDFTGSFGDLSMIGDVTAVGGGDDGLNPNHRVSLGLGTGVADGGGGRSNIRNFFKESRIENEFSGGIIGTLSGASAE